uniref:Diacylglycerol acyltransferase n=1 Tax=Oryza punctata TaxID=4537 RepID=A0A0E0KY85_ORYPU
MELTGATAAVLRGSLSTEASPVVLRGRGRGRRRCPARVSCVGRGGFGDEGHLRYYEGPPRKAVEAVARDLAKLRAMGLVAGDAAKEKVLSEATELLLEELNRMRDEEDELKKKVKEEKDAMKTLKQQKKEAMKAATVMKCDDDDSSESSESECEEQMMKMSCVATVTVPQIGEGVAMSMSIPQISSSDVTAAPPMEYDKAAMKAMKKREKEQKKAAKMAMKMKKKEKKMATLTGCKDDSTSCSSESSDSECEEVVRMSRCATITMPQTQQPSTVFPIILPQIPESVTLEPCQDAAQISSELANTMSSTTATIAVVEKPMTNRIEVCMGGKCKKSGSLAVLQEFEKKVGTDGAVVGCKCLGKCGLGPNVRLQTEGAAQKKNPLFIGVGLEDVGTIAAGLFGGDDYLGMVSN